LPSIPNHSQPFLASKNFFSPLSEPANPLEQISGDSLHANGVKMRSIKHNAILFYRCALENYLRSTGPVPAVFLVPQDSMHEKTMANLAMIRARKGPIIALATEGDRQVATVADDVIYIPETLEPVYPILATVLLQLFAYHIAVSRGCDVDRPRNLAKSVTVQ
jgi:glucosamine--fructose-6-phosphate aminotransferase (isomerizing)